MADEMEDVEVPVVLKRIKGWIQVGDTFLRASQVRRIDVSNGVAVFHEVEGEGARLNVHEADASALSSWVAALIGEDADPGELTVRDRRRRRRQR